MENANVYCEVGTEVLYIYTFNLALRVLKVGFVSDLSSSPQFQSWIGFIRLFGWHSRSALDNIIPQVADRHSDSLVQHSCIYLLRHSHTQRCEESCVVVRDGRLVFCLLHLKKLPTSRLLKTPQCIPHHERHSLLPFHLLCLSVFIPCTLLSLCLPSSLSNRRRKGFLELWRSWYMNCLFPLISTIWLMAMVEGNMNTQSPTLWVVTLCCMVGIHRHFGTNCSSSRFWRWRQYVLPKCVTWNVTPCGMVDIFLLFGGTNCLHHQDGISSIHKIYTGNFSTENRYICSRLHGITSKQDDNFRINGHQNPKCNMFQSSSNRCDDCRGSKRLVYEGQWLNSTFSYCRFSAADFWGIFGSF